MANQLTARITLQGGREVLNELKRIGSEGERAFKGLGTTISSAGRAIRDFGAGMSVVGGAIGGAVIGFGALAKAGAEAADAVGKAAQKIGISSEEFGKLKFAAEQNELTTEQLSTSMARLSKTMDSAAKGSGAAAGAFQKLGVSFEASDGKLRNASDVMLDLSDAFNALPDGAEKAALAIAIFGRAGAEMIPFLNQGSAEIRRLGAEAERLGLTFSEAETQIGDAFNDALAQLSDQLSTFANKIGLSFAPIFTELFGTISEFIATHKDTILGFFENLSATFQALPAPVQTLIQSLTALTIVLGPILVAIGVFVQVIGFAAGGLVTLGGGIAFVLTTIVPWVALFALAAVAAFKLGQAIGNLINFLLDLDWSAVGAGLVDAFNSAVEAVTSFFKSAWNGAVDFVKGLFADFLSYITGTWVGRIIAAIANVIQRIRGARQEANSEGGPGTRRASGGAIYGPGTSTSDSVPIWASRGEFMQPARAVRKYGRAFMESVRNLTFPGFADGGMIGRPAVASLAGVGNSAPRNVLNLSLDGREFTGMMLDDSTYEALARYASFQRLTSGGRKPAWYGSR